MQPFYSTERITELVRDVEQDLRKILGEEQGMPCLVSEKACSQTSHTTAQPSYTMYALAWS